MFSPALEQHHRTRCINMSSAASSATPRQIVRLHCEPCNTTQKHMLLFQHKTIVSDSDVGETHTRCQQRLRCLSCQSVLNLSWVHEQSHDQTGVNPETGNAEYDDEAAFINILDQKIKLKELPDALRSCQSTDENLEMPAPSAKLVQCLGDVQPILLSLLQEIRSVALVGAWELWHRGMYDLIDRFIKATPLPPERVEEMSLQDALKELCSSGTDELTRNISTALNSLIREDPRFPDGGLPSPSLRPRRFQFVLMVLGAFFVPKWANEVAIRKAAANAKALH